MEMAFDVSDRVHVLRATSLIKGVTAKNGIPFSCPVRVYNRTNGVLMSATISKPDGRYYLFGASSFYGNYILATDPEAEFNAAIQDNLY